MTVPTQLFDAIYHLLAQSGITDDVDGAEYHRVLREVRSMPTSAVIAALIWLRANISDDSMMGQQLKATTEAVAKYDWDRFGADDSGPLSAVVRRS